MAARRREPKERGVGSASVRPGDCGAFIFATQPLSHALTSSFPPSPHTRTTRSYPESSVTEVGAKELEKVMMRADESAEYTMAREYYELIDE